jgi:phosphate transport system protein
MTEAHRHFHDDLSQVKIRLLTMSGEAEAALGLAVEALLERDGRKAQAVVSGDRVIDRMEVELEEMCINLLALQQPMARDLRMLTSALKIANDLERVGDHAVNIAGSAHKLAGQPPLKPLVDIPRMADLAIGMLRDALDAFVRGDAVRARELCQRDDQVDDLDDQLFRELLTYMMENPGNVTRAMELILVARNLERVADLATNVAEEVVFIAEARIIKHHAEETVSGRRPDEDFGRS